MPDLPALPLTITIPTQHQRLLREVRIARNKVLSLDPVRRKLVIWYWPTDGNRRRVPPSDLPGYRNSHQLDNPYCLCLLFVTDRGATPKEAPIFIETVGPYSGEYVAKCAKNQCGYVVPLERLYDQIGLRVKTYPLRGPSDARPAPVLHVSEVERENQLQEAESDQLTPTRRVNEFFPTNGDGPPTPRRRRVLGPSNLPPAYQQLSSPTRPGLTLSEFRNLFLRCGNCGLVKTSDIFGTHKCAEVIDLTTDED